MLALITHAHAARALGNEPSKIENTTRCELIVLWATIETYVLVETKVHHHSTHISKQGPCGICVHGGNIGLVTNYVWVKLSGCRFN